MPCEVSQHKSCLVSTQVLPCLNTCLALSRCWASVSARFLSQHSLAHLILPRHAADEVGVEDASCGNVAGNMEASTASTARCTSRDASTTSTSGHSLDALRTILTAPPPTVAVPLGYRTRVVSDNTATASTGAINASRVHDAPRAHSDDGLSVTCDEAWLSSLGRSLSVCVLVSFSVCA